MEVVHVGYILTTPLQMLGTYLIWWVRTISFGFNLWNWIKTMSNFGSNFEIRIGNNFEIWPSLELKWTYT
jgi:hypothetical protein